MALLSLLASSLLELFLSELPGLESLLLELLLPELSPFSLLPVEVELSEDAIWKAITPPKGPAPLGFILFILIILIIFI